MATHTTTITRKRTRQTEHCSQPRQKKARLSAAIKVQADVCQIPHPEKAHYGGEDAYLIDPTHKLLGVFDGVSAYKNLPGGSPRDFAEMVKNSCLEEYKRTDDVYALLESAYESVQTSKIIGGTTALLAHVTCKPTLAKPVLEVLNLGDGALFLYRGGQIERKTNDQQHVFNTPYQFCHDPASDKPHNAERSSFELEVGDIVILTSDAVPDNIELVHMRLILSNNPLASPKEHATMIAKATFAASQSNRDTPFARNARKANITDWEGGKPDDITVVVMHYGC